jgi:hypothetical protein
MEFLSILINLLFSFMRWLLRRPKLTVRILEDDMENEVGGLRFEVENRRESPTSLQPQIRCSYYLGVSKRRIRRGNNRYAVREVDRELPPYKARIFHATSYHRIPNWEFTWFRTYVFYPTSGVKTKVRVRDCFLERLGMIRFVLDWIPFRLWRKVKDRGPKSIDDYESMKRFQGPH